MRKEGLSMQRLVISLLLNVTLSVYAVDNKLFPDPVSNESDWHQLRQDFQLKGYYYDEAVTAEVELFPQKYFDDWRERILKHQAYLNSKVKGKGLPGELALLPLIESELNGEARSPANAVGFWQMMPRTAKAYGLTVSDSNDGRKDLVLATDAALRHLEQLYKEMGDWVLVIAAYNIGGYRLRTLIKKSKSSNFWELDIPRETRRHVAKLLALSRVIHAPEQHGLKLPMLSTTQLSGHQFGQDSCCSGKARDITTVNRIKVLDIHKQLLRPPHWNTQPDNTVPINRPIALAM